MKIEREEKPMIRIFDSDISFEALLAQEDIDDETMLRAQNANILLLPDSDIREGIRAFQGQTVGFYKYALSKEEYGKVELFEKSGQEKILSLHNHDIFLPTMFVFSFVLPVVLNLASNYLYDLYRQPRDQGNLNVKLKIIVENQEKGISKQLVYQGPVEGFKNALECIDVDKIFEDNADAENLS